MEEECNVLELKTSRLRGGGGEERRGGGEKGRNNKWRGEEEEALVFKTIMLQSLTAAL